MREYLDVPLPALDERTVAEKLSELAAIGGTDFVAAPFTRDPDTRNQTLATLAAIVKIY